MSDTQRMAIDGVIFDMDGLLFDTEREFLECYARAAEECGYIEGIRETCIASIGTTRVDTEQRFSDAFGPTYPLAIIRSRAYDIRTAKRDAEGMPIKPGVVEILDLLGERFVPYVIASSSNREDIEENLDRAKLLHRFAHVIGGDEVERGKPEPEIFLKAARKIARAPERCAVLEDSVNGILAAFRAKTFPMLIPDLVEHPPESLARARRTFPSLLEARDYLAEIL